jgi:hypothetical protein
MEQLTFTFYDIVQIVLLLSACFACRAAGYQKGIADTVDFFHDKGIIEITDDDEVVIKNKE